MTKRRPFIEVYAAKATNHDAALDCLVTHTLGYRARCDCGERSKILGRWSQARDWARDHSRSHAAGAVVAAGRKP